MEKKLSDLNDTTCIIQLEFSTEGKKIADVRWYWFVVTFEFRMSVKLS